MWEYNHNNSNNSYLAHAGKKGMRWGYNDNRRNGKRTALEIETDGIITDKNELSRISDELKYKLERQKLDDKLSKKLRSGGHVDKDGYVDLNIKTVAIGADHVIKKGRSQILSVLNKIGSGKLDNKLTNAISKAKKMIKSLFNKK